MESLVEGVKKRFFNRITALFLSSFGLRTPKSRSKITRFRAICHGGKAAAAEIDGLRAAALNNPGTFLTDYAGGEYPAFCANVYNIRRFIRGENQIAGNPAIKSRKIDNYFAK
ncbi:hypothetical protein SDC9_155602 [bioreactor metagenome]|uniref:Uncharacterized protein n=1 Tax=bioreactor metagenome TaxID=1076179 RepID=A0A645F3B2_9ZZZZ